MNLQNLKNRKWNYVGLAFAFTFLGFLCVMIIKGMTPFGESSMLYSDAYHQYYPFFLAFRNALRSGESLLYSWDVGMGMDYLSLIAYYLASPLNLLSVLVPDSLTLVYFTLLIPIRLSFASMFFAMFLRKIFKKNDLSITLFGCFYGLCAWAMAYLWNSMWLDTFALLPLVIMGMVALLQERKFMLYTLTLFLSVFSNYYIGLFTCIFVLLVFICYQICRWESFNKFAIDLLLMGLFSMLAIAMTAVLELPALAALNNTQSSVNTFPTGFRLNIADENTWKGLLDGMRQVAGNMNGGIEPSFVEGLPNLYCGVFTIAFAFLYLMAPKVPVRDKVCAVLLLLFFNVSFIIRQLDYIWHGFHLTNMIPYRFSFLHSFVLLYMAYRAYLDRKRFRLWQVILASLLAIGIFMCSDSRFDTMFLAYNAAFLLLYIFILIYPHLLKKPGAEATEEEVSQHKAQVKERLHMGRSFLMVVIALEMVLNLVNFGANFTGTTTAFYPRGKEYTASMVRYMHEREWDELFFRAETTHSQTLNDGALNGYHGISTFTSSANVKVTEFMRKLGYGAKNTYNRYCYEESSPVSNLFLGIKYMLERQDRVEPNPFFNDLHKYGNVHLLENNAYLPLGFLANAELSEVSFQSELDPFVFQNELFSAATGMDENVWHHVSGEQLSITAADADIISTTPSGSCKFTTGSADGRINYQYTFETDGFLCVSLNLPNRNDFTLWLNGEELYSDTYTLPQMASVCQVSAGDVVDIAVACSANSSGTISVVAALTDNAVFWQGYDKLNQSTLELTRFHTTRVEGEILCNRDGLLYTSIPQDGNWHVYVDGAPAEAVCVGEVMVSVPLNKGYHTVTFRYRNSAFGLGLSVSLLSFSILMALFFRIYPARKRKGKYAK